MTVPGPGPGPGKLRTVVTHFEMTAAPAGAAPAPPAADVALVVARDIDVSFYRFLYKEVGEAWLWWELLAMGDEALAARLAAPGIEVHVLRVGAEPAGFGEIDRRDKTAPRLRYFGLRPAFIGRGLGAFMLERILRLAWRRPARRVLLDTCDLDHPGARAFYERHGFRATRSETRQFDDPRLTGLMSTDAAPHIPLA